MIREFIEILREEREGYSFDRPVRISEKNLSVVVPILRDSELEREYMTLAEARDLKVEDTGQIDFVYVKNESASAVLVSRGDIFRGKTQERAAIHDTVIERGHGARVAVRCIHQTRGISDKAEMGYGGRTPYDVTFRSQQETWSSVSNYVTASSMSTFPTEATEGQRSSGPTVFRYTESDNLVKTIDEMSIAVKDVMKKIPFKKNQVGAVFLYENKVKGLDVYDLSASWEAVKNDVIEKEGADFIKEDGDAVLFEMKMENAKSLLQKELGSAFTEKVLYTGSATGYELIGEKLVGEGIVYKGRVIHLTLWTKN